MCYLVAVKPPVTFIPKTVLEYSHILQVEAADFVKSRYFRNFLDEVANSILHYFDLLPLSRDILRLTASVLVLFVKDLFLL